MELNLNSLHARIFRWVLFVSKDRMPKSLCPYFWQSVLMWLFIVPILVMSLPVRIIKIFKGDHYNWRSLTFVEAIARSVIFYASFFVGYCMGFFIYCLLANVNNDYIGAHELEITVGLIAWFILISIGIIYCIVSIKDYYERKKWEKYNSDDQQKKNVIVESVKGIYNKYCPRIDWKDQK